MVNMLHNTSDIAFKLVTVIVKAQTAPCRSLLGIADYTTWPFICRVVVKFTFEELLLANAMGVGLRRSWSGGLGRLAAR